MLYSCGNVIVLIVIVHFINNWFMMILVAVLCVFENKCYEEVQVLYFVGSFRPKGGLMRNKLLSVSPA